MSEPLKIDISKIHEQNAGFYFMNIPANWQEREYAETGRNLLKRWYLKAKFAYRDWRKLDHVYPTASKG